MKTTCLLVLLGASLCLVVSCSDDDSNGNGQVDSGPGPVDGSQGVDNGTGVDSGTGVPDGGGGTDAKVGHLSCQLLGNCVGGCCPQDDQACEEACKDSLAPGAAEAREAMVACAEEQCANCPSDKECTACMETNCTEEVAACTHGTGGSANCSVTHDCFAACPAMTLDESGTAETCPTNAGLVCLQNCLDAATPTGAALVYKYGYCQYVNCSVECTPDMTTTACTTCLADKCADEAAACEGDV